METFGDQSGKVGTSRAQYAAGEQSAGGVVFDDTLLDRQLLEQYRKRIVTARTVVYVFAGIFICYNIDVAVDRVGSDLPVLPSTYTQLLLYAVLLVVNAYSHYKPFVPMLLISIVGGFFVVSLLVVAIMTIGYSLSLDAVSSEASIELMCCILLFFVIRGTIAGWKYQRMKRKILP